MTKIAEFNSCKYHHYDSGSKLYGENIPLSAYGSYPPGEGPGYKCKETGMFCGLQDVDIDECPRMEKTKILCPICHKELEEKDFDLILYYDLLEDRFYCPEEQVFYEKEEICKI